MSRLRQDGVLVYGFGNAQAPEAFRTACTRYIDVSQLIKTAAAPETQVRAAQPIDPELIELLSTAWKSAKRGEDGFARVSEIGQIAGNRSSFDVRNYGFKRLSDLIRAANGNFVLEQRENGHLWVKQVR